jgi:hypothetical protein
MSHTTDDILEVSDTQAYLCIKYIVLLGYYELRGGRPRQLMTADVNVSSILARY